MGKQTEVECMLNNLKDQVKHEFESTNDFKTVRKSIIALMDQQVAEILTELDTSCKCKGSCNKDLL